MANRKNTFLLKRSNIAGKIPSAGDLQLGELALNIADNILYASGTTANSILPIGWDRVARTGDTMTGGLFTPYLSATTISATTYLNLPPTTFSGGTVTGPTNFTNGLTANTMSATTYYGDGSNLTGISAAATEFVVNCRNQSGSDMYRGQIVYMNGSTGNRPTILLAQANSEMTSARTFGVLKNNISNNGFGDVVVIGSITNLDTRTSATHPFTIETLSDGQTIYLSPTNAGYITNVKPHAPNHLVYIGKVVRTHPTNGYIEYQIQNGYELDELHDVKITGVTYGDLLTYSGYNGSNVWVNSKTLNGSYTMTGLTVNGNTTTTTLSATSITADTVTTFIPIFTPLEIYRGITFRNNSTTIDTYGGIAMSTTASNLAQSVSSTNFASKQIRLRYYATVVSGGRYTGTRGSVLLWFIGGGFRYVCDFNISDTAFASTCQQFYGLAGQTTDLGYGGVGLVQVSTLTNLIGLGNDGTDTNLQIIHNDSGGTATKIDLGVNFPANRTAGAASTTVYSLTLYNAPASNYVKYMVINNETGAVAMGTIITNLPDTTQGLNFFASRAMGSGGGVTNSGQFDLLKLGVNSLL